MEVWQTSNLRPLRLGEEKKKEERRNRRARIQWSALFHRATIKSSVRSMTRQQKLQLQLPQFNEVRFLTQLRLLR